jgi:hypothetical protein
MRKCTECECGSSKFKHGHIILARHEETVRIDTSPISPRVCKNVMMKRSIPLHAYPLRVFASPDFPTEYYYFPHDRHGNHTSVVNDPSLTTQQKFLFMKLLNTNGVLCLETINQKLCLWITPGYEWDDIRSKVWGRLKGCSRVMFPGYPVRLYRSVQCSVSYQEFVRDDEGQYRQKIIEGLLTLRQRAFFLGLLETRGVLRIQIYTGQIRVWIKPGYAWSDIETPIMRRIELCAVDASDLSIQTQSIINQWKLQGPA